MSIQTRNSSHCKVFACQRWEPAGRILYRWLWKFCELFRLKPIIILNTTQKKIVQTEQSRHYGVLFMKTFYNVVNSIICCGRKRVLRSSWILSECNLSSKIGKTCILCEVCMTTKKKTAPPCLPQMWCIKSIKGSLTRHQICWQDFISKINLSNTKNSSWLFILAFHFRQSNAAYKFQPVNWLPPRAIASYNRPL